MGPAALGVIRKGNWALNPQGVFLNDAGNTPSLQATKILMT